MRPLSKYYPSLIVAVFLLLVSGGRVLAQAVVTPVPCPVSGNDVPSLQCGETIFANTLKAFFALAGVVAFIYLLLGGFRYITAGGEDKEIGEARKMITGAMTGLLLVVAAYALLSILSYYVFNSNALFRFTIPG